MTRVYAFDSHTYQHSRPRKSIETYSFAKDQVQDVPPDVANIVCAAHPQKLQILAEGEPLPSEVTVEVATEKESTKDKVDRLLHTKITVGKRRKSD